MSGHIPVLLNEIVEAIDPQDGDIIVDGTFGGGGYTKAILDKARCRVFGIDRDPDAIDRGKELSSQLDERLTMLKGCYGDMAALVNQKVNAVVLDIGVSSFQIDEADRGFSFREDGPLDMRMAQSGESAADVVNTYAEKDIADIIYKYGEERRSRQVARAIIEARKEGDITTTNQLAKIVRSVVWQAKDKIDPATRTFQGLRIYVNDELGELERGLAAAEEILKPGGRLVVVTFHSLEDRIVKKFFKERSGSMPRGNKYAPDLGDTGPKASFKLINRKPIAPSDQENRANPRARSSKLRAGLRTEAPAWTGGDQ
ncbi:16S rRNA (cytosine(1402)-N(4))-methyltransferase RsmH [Terasakiella sp. A23]|uniref:16S rRNA (cytosine(1402)-N(4))-methyltransferase RsmH n=1 Tax=Terasakiella sp. FCG-A23 TaxID=3080561 RepID=UPI002955AB4A|nr:16S rRNA (cytosine(1402)-N(4))-methyltransferase RsmH [Terasakiella sp. A23]MDV7340043.1 16S rRNA (cytosine(1402)-N(4))-methyltransferase RsmH [Terasakiella sp. A23]